MNFRININSTIMLLRDLFCCWHSWSYTKSFGRKQRLKYFIHQFLRNSTTAILIHKIPLGYSSNAMPFIQHADCLNNHSHHKDLTTTQDEPTCFFFKFEYFANLGHYYHRYFAGDKNALDIHDITFHLDPLHRC